MQANPTSDLERGEGVSLHPPDASNGNADDPLSLSNPNRLRRLSSATALTSFSTAITLSEPPPSLWTRFKDFINPPTPTAYIPNFRLTPIISGILIPMAILLDIPGLTSDWYLRTQGGVTVESKPDSVVLDVGLWINLFFGVLANVVLVVRFLEKNVKTMTVLCIVFLGIHDIINIVATTTFSVQHRNDAGFTYGQAFWSTVTSTAVSSVTNVTLIIDLIRTPNFTRSGSGLTRKQRSLLIAVIVLVCYIALGALVNSRLIKLSFINGLYFTVCSIETIGFGDIVPVTPLARIWVCIYSTGGILNIALSVALTREAVLEALEIGYRKRMHKARERRKEVHRRRAIESRWRSAVERRLRDANQPVWVSDMSSAQRVVTEKAKAWLPRTMSVHEYGAHKVRLNYQGLSAGDLEACATAAGAPLETLLPIKQAQRHSMWGSVQPMTHVKLGRMAGMLTHFAMAVHEAGEGQGGQKEEAEEKDVDKNTVDDADDKLTKRIEVDERKAFYARLIFALTLFALFWFVGSAIFMATEGWKYGTAMYFCFVAFTTIGYGDYSPQTAAGRAVFVVWALLGVGTMTILISVISQAFFSSYKSALHQGAFDRALKLYRQHARSRHQPPSDHQDQQGSSTTPLTASEVDAPHSSDWSHDRAEEHAREKVEALPAAIVALTRTFQEDIRFFLATSGWAEREIPDGLSRLMDDIASAARAGAAVDDRVQVLQRPGVPVRMGRRIRREILRDDEARHNLFTLSIETALQKITDVAKEASEALAQRDGLEVQQDGQDTYDIDMENENSDDAPRESTLDHEPPQDEESAMA